MRKRATSDLNAALPFGKAASFCWIVALTLSCSFAVAAEPHKRILVFSSEDPYLPSITQLTQAIRTTLKNGIPGGVTFYYEALEDSRIPGDKYETELVSLLRRKYEGQQIDLSFAFGAPALKFLLKHQNELFRHTPILFVVQDESRVAGLDLGLDATGVWGKMELTPTLDIALALQPETRRVLVVSGSAPLNKALLAKAHQDFRVYEGKVEFNYLTDLSIQDFQKQMASLPPKTIVFYLGILADSTGNTYSNPEALSLLAPSSNTPIYSTQQNILGNGIVGGSVINYEVIGARTGELGLRILAGTKPRDIPPETVPSVAMFDWRQLRRWGISEQSLPPGSIIQFRQPSVWELYKWRIVGVISLCLLEALLIIGLLLSRRRRRHAEKENQRLARVAEAERKRRDEVVSNVPGIVWEMRFEADHKTRKTYFVSDYVEQMLGYSVEEWLATPNFALTIMADEDRERVASETEAILESGTAGFLQFRWKAKDGRLRWVEAQVAAICDDTGKPIGLRGVTMDITERRLAEELVREGEERLKQAISVARFGVFEHDHLTGILHSSPLTREIHAWGEDDTSNLEGLVAQVHAEDRETFLAALRRAHDPAGDGFFSHEYRILLDGGKVRWVSARAKTFFDGENGARRPARTIGAELDITERKEAEEALRVSESRFRTLADSAPLLIWMCGTDQLCIYLNQGWLDFTGRTIEQELGYGWTAGIFSEDYARCFEVFDSAFDRREPFKLEYRLRRADGVFRWVYVSGTPRFSSAGEFLGYIGSCIDIADRKEAEEGLQKAHEEVNKLKNQLQEENIYLKEEIKLEHNFHEIVGQSDEIKYTLFKIEQVAPTDSTVIIMGETGTGKELVARAIHGLGPRKDRPLVKINCATLPASLIESELFGHERGAFTGAHARKPGRFEIANGATLFLDEVGELPIELQPKLLRVLQEGEFERVGGSKTIKVDVRIIAATNRNLRAAIQKGLFREDLWYRLSVFPITVQPLRQRKNDIPLLVNYFVDKFSRKLARSVTSISPTALRALEKYSWPGNVRELANVIERAVISSQGPALQLADRLDDGASTSTGNGSQSLIDVERTHILKVLESIGWKIEGNHGAARILGLNPSTLRTRMAKLRIQRPDESSR